MIAALPALAAYRGLRRRRGGGVAVARPCSCCGSGRAGTRLALGHAQAGITTSDAIDKPIPGQLVSAWSRAIDVVIAS